MMNTLDGINDMPNEAFARQVIDLEQQGRVLLFPGHAVKFTEVTDPYYDCHVKLAKRGLHRNVFLVDSDGNVIWRIDDYRQSLPDAFISIKCSEEQGKIIGQTFHGHIFTISLADGTLKRTGWTK